MKTKLMALMLLVGSAAFAGPRFFVGARLGFPAPVVAYNYGPPVVAYASPYGAPVMARLTALPMWRRTRERATPGQRVSTDRAGHGMPATGAVPMAARFTAERVSRAAGVIIAVTGAGKRTGFSLAEADA